MSLATDLLAISILDAWQGLAGKKYTRSCLGMHLDGCAAVSPAMETGQETAVLGNP